MKQPARTPPDVINLRRIELGVSFAEMERRTGINRGTLNTKIQDVDNFPHGQLKKLAAALQSDWRTWIDAA